MQDIEKELKEITGLISLPEIYLKIRRLMEDETSSIDDFANVIIIDPNLSTRVLKLVNSAVFGLSEPVDSITRAINLIGIDQLHNMVLGASAMSSLELPNDILPLKSFWHNSLYTGVLTQQFAARLRQERSDRLFIAGLLHEIGHLVLCAKFPDLARETIMVSIRSGQPLHEVQRQMLGLHYGDIGAMLIANWNLPTELQELIRFQPEPMMAPSRQPAAALLHLAHAYAGQDIANNLVAAEDLVEAGVRAMIDLSQQQIEECLAVARSVSREIGNSILA